MPALEASTLNQHVTDLIKWSVGDPAASISAVINNGFAAIQSCFVACLLYLSQNLTIVDKLKQSFWKGGDQLGSTWKQLPVGLTLPS